MLSEGVRVRKSRQKQAADMPALRTPSKSRHEGGERKGEQRKPLLFHTTRRAKGKQKAESDGRRGKEIDCEKGLLY